MRKLFLDKIQREQCDIEIARASGQGKQRSPLVAIKVNGEHAGCNAAGMRRWLIIEDVDNEEGRDWSSVERRQANSQTILQQRTPRAFRTAGDANSPAVMDQPM